MTGKFRKTEALYWPIRVKVPVGKDRFETEKFECKFKLMTDEERKEYTLTTELPKEHTTRDILDTELVAVNNIINFWQDWTLVDEAGQKMPFTSENIEMVLNETVYRKAIFEAFWVFQNGGAITKN